MYVDRAAIEKEKKTHVHNFEHRQAMEKHLVSMAREIKKLHAELANAERRARAADAAAAANPSKLFSNYASSLIELQLFANFNYLRSLGIFHFGL